MRAIQVLWSMPRASFMSERQEQDESFRLRDFDILLMVLSAAKWRQLNGTVRLYTDDRALRAIEDVGLVSLWDDVDNTLLNRADTASINPRMFWCAGRLLALQQEECPCVFLDLDMIVWRDLREFYHDVDVRFTHWESVQPSYWYCRRKDLRTPSGYRFRRAWDWSVPAANMAIFYVANGDFKNYYVGEALRFMKNNSVAVEVAAPDTPELLFADQRLLTLCAREMRVTADPFLRAVWSPKRSAFVRHDPLHGPWRFDIVAEQPLFTHLWFSKLDLLEDPLARAAYCQELASAITAHFPAYAGALRHVKEVAGYFA